MEESFMLLSLKEKESKRLAQVIGSDTCRAILAYLTDKEYATETQIAKEMGVPLSTVHYNLKALLQSRLVVADEYHYSDKGKEVPHYKLAKKYIIIAPREERGVMERIRKYLPITAIALGVAAAIEFGLRWFSAAGKSFADQAPDALMVASEHVVEESLPAAGARLLALDAAPIVAHEPSRWFPSPVAFWFLAGALFIIFSFAIWDWVRSRS